MIHSPTAWLGGESIADTSILLVAGIVFTLIMQKLLIFQSSEPPEHLERLHDCQSPPSESDLFRYDFLGIAKAVELGLHFRRRTSLPYTTGLFEKYGETYKSSILGYRLVFTCDSQNTTHILSTAFGDFDSSPLRKSLFEPITPHGIFTLDGRDWKKSREKLRSRLSNLRKVIDLSLCERHFQAFLTHVPPNGQVFDVQPCVFALSLDIQTSFSLGQSVEALSHTQSQDNKEFVEDLLYVKERIVQDGFRGPLRYLFPRRRFLVSCKRVRKYAETRFRANVTLRQSNIKYHAQDETTAQTAQQEVSELTDQALSILLANDSMGTALSALFFCLSKSPRILHKLRESIIHTVGLEPPTWEKLGALHYVRWTLHEVLRLFPAVVLNARVANKDSILPTGGGTDHNSPVLLRKGDIVVFSTWARHRLGKDFGDNLDEFCPERWEGLSGSMPGYIPFNKGPRVCPGQHYAMVVLIYIVVRIFQTFSTVVDYNTRPWTERISMTLENENGVMVGLH